MHPITSHIISGADIFLVGQVIYTPRGDVRIVGRKRFSDHVRYEVEAMKKDTVFYPKKSWWRRLRLKVRDALQNR